MSALLSLLAYDREDLMVAALAGLMVAGVVVAIGAWLLFFREARWRAVAEPAPGTEGTQPIASDHGERPQTAEPAEVPEIRAGDPEP